MKLDLLTNSTVIEERNPPTEFFLLYLHLIDDDRHNLDMSTTIGQIYQAKKIVNNITQASILDFN
jgi:hypothetical protein